MRVRLNSGLDRIFQGNLVINAMNISDWTDRKKMESQLVHLLGAAGSQARALILAPSLSIKLSELPVKTLAFLAD